MHCKLNAKQPCEKFLEWDIMEPGILRVFFKHHPENTNKKSMNTFSILSSQYQSPGTFLEAEHSMGNLFQQLITWRKNLVGMGC